MKFRGIPLYQFCVTHNTVDPRSHRWIVALLPFKQRHTTAHNSNVIKYPVCNRMALYQIASVASLQ